jgi:hypothetical protein
MGCPNYEPKGSGYYCSICKYEILVGEECLKDDNGDYAHFDCINDMSTRKMLNWLGYPICRMRDYEDD